MEFAVKFKLIDYYLSSIQTQILTPKDILEWAHQHSFDPSVAKAINQQLVGEGILRERKKPFLFYQIVDSTDDQGLASKL